MKSSYILIILSGRHENALGNFFECDVTGFGNSYRSQVTQKFIFVFRHLRTPKLSPKITPIFTLIQCLICIKISSSVKAKRSRCDWSLQLSGWEEVLSYPCTAVVRGANKLLDKIRVTFLPPDQLEGDFDFLNFVFFCQLFTSDNGFSHRRLLLNILYFIQSLSC